ncbi:hypothetical protein UY3_15800, partial [Chelonia mydas]
WQTPSSIPPTSKRAEKKYLIAAKGFEYLYTHLPPVSLVVLAANKKDKQGHSNSTPKNKEAKRLNLFRRKIYSTASLQFQVTNHQALLGQYNFNLWDSLHKFKDSMLQEVAQDFGALVEEGTAATQCSLQMAWDVADSAARVVTSVVVMRLSSWLQIAGLSQEMQSSIQDLPFDGLGLFANKWM